MRLEFDTDKRDTVGVRVDRKRRQYVSAFLRALGIAETDEEILALFDGAESIRNTLERDPVTDKDEALLDLYRKLRPEPTTVESARNLMQTLFRNPKRYDLTRVGRYKLDQKFGRPEDSEHRSGRGSSATTTSWTPSATWSISTPGPRPLHPPTAPRYRCKPTTSTTSATAGCAPSAS